MPRLLTNLDIQEVSSVDRGAAKGARALLFKRDAKLPDQATIDKALALAIKSALDEGGKIDDLVTLFKQFQSFVGSAPQQEIEMTQEEIAKLVAEEVAKALAAQAKKDEPKPVEAVEPTPAPVDKTAKDSGNDADEDDVPPKKGKKPFGKADAEVAEIAKRDEEIKKLSDEVKKLRDKDQQVEFAKRAIGLGLTEGEGEMLLKAHRGDPEALAKMEEKIASLVKQVNTGDLFKEFGSGGSAGGNAHDQLVAKAGEIRKRAGSEKLTAEAAYVKAMEENPEIAKAEKIERDRRINKSAQ